MKDITLEKASEYLNILCSDITNRSVGSSGNIEATDFFEKIVSSFGWEIEKDELEVMDWDCGTVSICTGGKSFHAMAGPYSKGCSVEAVLVPVSSMVELEKADLNGRAVLLHGEITSEQLMPKNFVFYNPEEHRKIVSLLENSGASVIICATARNSALAGGVYPFPLIEDGDFDVPSVYMTDIEGSSLLEFKGGTVSVKSSARRIPSKAYNITALKRKPEALRIVLTAHIDAKKGTPGAIDNATGVLILMFLAEMLRDYSGPYQIEMAAFNGEDYYAVPGQMAFIRKNHGLFGNIALNINIDGAGYTEGDTAFSFYGVSDEVREIAIDVISCFKDASVGPEWPQGDHSIFVQFGVPAIAVSSMWLSLNMENQTITHTPEDKPEIVDIRKTAQAAETISKIVNNLV